MKKIIAFHSFFTLLLLAQTVVSLAQKNEGVIQFAEKINMHRQVPEAAKAFVPEFRTTKMQLTFKAKESYYKESDEVDPDEAANAGAEGGGGMRAMMFAPSETYRNLATRERIEQREWQGKTYLVTDTLKKQAWKLTTEKRTIAGYECTKATMTDSVRARRSSVAVVGRTATS